MTTAREGHGTMATQQTQNICITFTQCRTNVEDVGPTLCKCNANVLCLMVRAWRFANVEPRLVQDFQINIMFLPSRYWDIVPMLCPWASHLTLKCFT